MNDEMLRFKVAIDAGVPIPTDIAQNFSRAIDLYNAGEYKSLCAALGWRRKAGERKSQTNNAIAVRNHFLHRAILQIGGITFANCEKLADEILRWQAVTSKITRLNPNYPLTKMQKLLQRAESRGKLPTTSSGLWQALTKD
jgi:hypothetical protein